jgi:hypothetical protein
MVYYDDHVSRNFGFRNFTFFRVKKFFSSREIFTCEKSFFTLSGMLYMYGD